MRTLRFALLAALLAAWVGCSAAGPPPLSRVTVGMSAREVDAILGSPCAREQNGPQGQMEVWYYDAGVVILQDAEVKFRFPVAVPRS
ncbi:MAG: hypothetical protein KAX19_00515 [Candidatus Brocadiae bacterium]|nr:hypothetical protein [Candidatus Brocadiia bacterium]